MRAQRARCDTVDSYKREGSVLSLLIRCDKIAFHESGVRVKHVTGLGASLGIHGHSAESEIYLANKSSKICQRGRIPSFGMGARGVGWRRGAVNRPGEIEVDRAERPRVGVDDRQRLTASGFPVFALIITGGKRGRPKSGAENGPSGAHCSVN